MHGKRCFVSLFFFSMLFFTSTVVFVPYAVAVTGFGLAHDDFLVAVTTSGTPAATSTTALDLEQVEKIYLVFAQEDHFEAELKLKNSFNAV